MAYRNGRLIYCITFGWFLSYFKILVVTRDYFNREWPQIGDDPRLEMALNWRWPQIGGGPRLGMALDTTGSVRRE
jgi:hypothetical protein